MEGKYLFESFSADVSAFDTEFTGFLNGKYGDGWKVKGCTYCHNDGKTYASCLFKNIGNIG
ncbi:hypothetical protein [Syntrophobacter fumaroxidans]|uniref:hypothetical protein n=1 Tax=Syntrophobacter fumaroxidans TaxID=119484 RepID=UPI00005745D1|nr:hypothetical protein [Syntrophobacter fumaroxidans]